MLKLIGDAVLAACPSADGALRCAAAAAQEVLVSARARADLVLEGRELLSLKGIGEPQPAFRLRWRDERRQD